MLIKYTHNWNQDRVFSIVDLLPNNFFFVQSMLFGFKLTKYNYWHVSDSWVGSTGDSGRGYLDF